MALTTKDAKTIIGMVGRGDKRHDIAAWFGENQARIAEAENGDYGTLEAAPINELPPRGAPGPKGRRLRSKVLKAIEALDAGDTQTAKSILAEGIVDFNKNEV